MHVMKEQTLICVLEASDDAGERFEDTLTKQRNILNKFDVKLQYHAG